MRTDDPAQIDRLVGDFFAAFDNRAGRAPLLQPLLDLFVPGAIVLRDDGARCEHLSVADFAGPRVRLLAGGELLDFHEWETSASTQVFGSVATRLSTYRKAGVLRGAPYAGGGTKCFQLARLASGWRIGALAWSDDA